MIGAIGTLGVHVRLAKLNRGDEAVFPVETMKLPFEAVGLSFVAIVNVTLTICRPQIDNYHKRYQRG